jgi:probable rRNA maturation factor
MEARTCVPFLRTNIRKALNLLHSPVTDLSIAIVPSNMMSRLHKKHMGIRGPTDVLTFALDHDARGRPTAGEIILCSTVARRQAQQCSHSLRDELLLYAVHGLLHLSGFDDRTASAFAAMHAKEDQILTQLGIGPVFTRGSR